MCVCWFVCVCVFACWFVCVCECLFVYDFVMLYVYVCNGVCCLFLLVICVRVAVC